jgi:hypothetical protein
MSIDMEEVKQDRINEQKQEMYEEMAYQKRLAEDPLGTLLEKHTDDIQQAYDLLKPISDELFRLGVTMREWDILKEL